jgi:ABC-type sugar transport system ATPase subunit
MSSIRLEHVTKTYPGGHAAVCDLTLDVADGELLVLAGPSGCGKTTTLKLITGLEAPSGGNILLDADVVTRWPPHRRELAMVFQSHSLFPHLTVRGNLEFGLRLRRTPRTVLRERVIEVARLLELEPLLDGKPSQLSGGQRQRVALGRALAHSPRAFLLDEPLSNLDAQLRVQTRIELRRLLRRVRTTVVHVTHDQEEAMLLADRLAVMNAGTLQQVAPPLEIYRRPANLFVARFIGSPPMNLLRCVCQLSEKGMLLVAPSFRIALPPSKAQPPAEVVLGIRPHDLRLVGPADADLDAEVEMVQPLGSEQHAQLSVPGQPKAFTLVTPASTALAGGDRLHLHFPREHLHLFDPADGSRLTWPHRL